MSTNDKLKKLRSLKKGTRFFFYGKDDVKLIAIAGDKRGKHQRDCSIEGKDGTYNFRSDDVVEIV